MSLRVGVTLTALAPLTVASVMVARNELLERLQYAASHDPLTHVLNRGGFMQRADALLATPQLMRRPLAVLMMDSISSRRSTTATATRPATRC